MSTAAYRAVHRDELREKQRAYREAHRDESREYQRSYKLRNPEIAARWDEANRQRRRELNRKWAKANPDRRRANEALRRARIAYATCTSFTTEQLHQRMAMFGHRCWMCGGPFEHVDHVKPLSKGGMHALANLRPACATCNVSKKDRWDGPRSSYTGRCGGRVTNRLDGTAPLHGSAA